MGRYLEMFGDSYNFDSLESAVTFVSSNSIFNDDYDVFNYIAYRLNAVGGINTSAEAVRQVVLSYVFIRDACGSYPYINFRVLPTKYRKDMLKLLQYWGVTTFSISYAMPDFNETYKFLQKDGYSNIGCQQLPPDVECEDYLGNDVIRKPEVVVLMSRDE